jgi:hypothetical protein
LVLPAARSPGARNKRNDALQKQKCLSLLESSLVTDLQSTTVMVGDTSCFNLLLDINQTLSSPLLALNQLQFYISPTVSQTSKDVSYLETLRYSFSPVMRAIWMIRATVEEAA